MHFKEVTNYGKGLGVLHKASSVNSGLASQRPDSLPVDDEEKVPLILLTSGRTGLCCSVKKRLLGRIVIAF